MHVLMFVNIRVNTFIVLNVFTITVLDQILQLRQSFETINNFRSYFIALLLSSESRLINQTYFSIYET